MVQYANHGGHDTSLSAVHSVTGTLFSPNIAEKYDRCGPYFTFNLTLSPSCWSWSSLGTMESVTTELLGQLKGGSPFIWGHYNSTKACGCLHTEQSEMNGRLLYYTLALTMDRQGANFALCGLPGQAYIHPTYPTVLFLYLFCFFFI